MAKKNFAFELCAPTTLLYTCLVSVGNRSTYRIEPLSARNNKLSTSRNTVWLGKGPEILVGAKTAWSRVTRTGNPKTETVLV